MVQSTIANMYTLLMVKLGAINLSTAIPLFMVAVGGVSLFTISKKHQSATQRLQRRLKMGKDKIGNHSTEINYERYKANLKRYGILAWCTVLAGSGLWLLGPSALTMTMKNYLLSYVLPVVGMLLGGYGVYPLFSAKKHGVTHSTKSLASILVRGLSAALLLASSIVLIGLPTISSILAALKNLVTPKWQALSSFLASGSLASMIVIAVSMVGFVSLGNFLMKKWGKPSRLSAWNEHHRNSTSMQNSSTQRMSRDFGRSSLAAMNDSELIARFDVASLGANTAPLSSPPIFEPGLTSSSSSHSASSLTPR